MNEKFVCSVCGAELDAESLVTVANGDLVCEDCLAENFGTCADCGEYFPLADLTEVSGGDLVCEDCLSNDYFRCEHCGEYHLEDDSHLVHCGWRTGTQTWCDDCACDDAFWCEGCEEWYSLQEYESYTAPNGMTYCESCFDDTCTICARCGEVIWRDDSYWSDDYDDYLCEDCYDRCSRGRAIHDYGYKPRAEFHSRKGVYDRIPETDHDLYFGIEDECDKGDDASACAEKIQSITDALYIKHDGSLDCGFEIVTHPCTLAYHMYEMPWKHICKTALADGFKSHDARTCGLHVHVGVGQMASNYDEQRNIVGRIVLLVDRHWDALVKFSRRHENQLSHWAVRPSISHATRTADTWIQDALRTRRAGRYQAINLTNLDGNNTIEFRLFNGTLKRDTIIATLQFLSNLCKYAMAHTTEEVLASNFTDIVSVETYRELTAYLEERNLVEVAPLEPASILTFSEPIDPDRPLQVGDWVQCVNACGGGIAEEAIGQTGRVMAVYAPDRAGVYDIGVRLDCDEFNLGHRLEDIDDPYISGYYFHLTNLVRIA